MISALQNGKYSIDKKEDVITSSIFDNLFLLPDNIIWSIIRNSCYEGNKLPEDAGNMLRDETDFWPSWHWEGRVEPDLFIRFKNIDIIIEAKREYNKQNIGQWEKQYKSYNNEYDAEKVALIAIDGTLGVEEKEWDEFDVFITNWWRLYGSVITERQKISKAGDPLSLIQIRIFDIIIRYFDYFGIYKIVWPNEVLKQNIKLINYQLSMKVLKQIGEEYQDQDKGNDTDCLGDILKLVNSNIRVANFTGNMKLLAKMEEEYGQL
jgi:hypothetical protein